MLDNETKRRIDTARDILVGKVPDPKSQVEQITIALIYKFMDDMDKEAVSFGGKPTFFAQPKPTGNESLDIELKDFPKYSWTKIFDSKLGGHEMFSLYSEALLKLNLNPNIPKLFRDIFKNAYLPYRDPETLKLFLKTINEFHYDHSEKLGDAFEYLLSIMGSQGDAGQFRTPRHIIDFIVEVMQPKKTETICDPACGTAGFLISSYKHILKENTKKTKGDLLTPDNRKKMMQNFVGYDISPDMVRLSLVNLYLHGFTTPSIYEYDTLTSEDRWNEYFDVIIANPPFMTPKGGIKPHKKFTVQANRSEVLFVDYIAEHIHPSTGRAGIIVPEGIIFQSATAYKALRKMLVDKNYLYAVVSLPAGVFNPYSGVKTSILLMDKTLAKKTDKILFVKIENDGFDLGAQRREIDKNDLPEALNILQQYKEALLNNSSNAEIEMLLKNPKDSNVDRKAESFSNLNPKDSNVDRNDIEGNNTTPSESNQTNQTSAINIKSLRDSQALLVEKKKIGEKDDYNLSVDRYRENGNAKQSHFEMVRLGEIVDLVRGITFGKKDQLDIETDDSIRVATTKAAQENGIVAEDLYFIPKKFVKSDEKYLKEGDILISTANSLNLLGRTTFVSKLNYQCSFGAFMSLIRTKNEKVLPTFLFYCLRTQNAKTYFEVNANTTTNISNLSFNALNDFEIPLPPISIQQQIVSKIEQYQAIINGAKQVVENYKPQIEIKEEWEMVELKEVLEKINDNINPQSFKGKVNYVGLENIESNSGSLVGNIETDYSEIKSAKTRFAVGDILYGKLRPNLNKVLLTTFEGIASTDIFVLREREGISNANFYSSYLRSEKFNSEVLTGLKGAQLPRVGFEHFSDILIPLPSIQEQEGIVKQIEQEQEIINGNKRLIALYEQKIKDEINKLWKQPASAEASAGMEPKEYA